MLRSTPRIEVNQRSREARLRLERVERLIVVVMPVVACPEDQQLGCQELWPEVGDGVTG